MISTLTDSELHSRTLAVSIEEKNATYRLLEHLNEIERRRSYLALGYHSLWNYVEQGLGYSHAQTAERVASVTTVKIVPEALEAIARRTLSITTAAQIGRTIRNGKKTSEEAKALFEECDGKSSREIERILLPTGGEPKTDRVRPVSRTTTSIQIEVDEEFMTIARRAMELSGEFSMRKVLRKVLEKYVRSKEIPKSRATDAAVVASTSDTPASASDARSSAMESRVDNIRELPPEHRIPNARYIPSENRHAVRMRSGDRCEFSARETKRRCDARSRLEFHHLNPYALFGSHATENLMHVCRSHHRVLEKRSR